MHPPAVSFFHQPLLSSWLPAGWTAALPQWLATAEVGDGLLLVLTPLFMLAVLLEAWRFRHRGSATRAGAAGAFDARPVYQWRDSLASLNLGGAYTVLDIVIVLCAVLPAMAWVHQHRWLDIDITPWTFAGLYLGVEFCYYWFHRASHRVRWFWCAHVVHHGSEHMNFTTAMRQSWLYSFAGNWLFYLPMVWLGFEPRWVLLALSFNLGYQFFVHTQWVGRLPAPIEYIFNTPSHHRAHHGRNPAYIDRNYGGTLIVFDRLFGTYVDETEPVDYGLVERVDSSNPFWLTVHQWVAMARDMKQPGPWQDRLRHAWKPPEWQRTRDNPPHATQRTTRHRGRPAA